MAIEPWCADCKATTGGCPQHAMGVRYLRTRPDASSLPGVFRNWCGKSSARRSGRSRVIHEQQRGAVAVPSLQG
jgi:hypothetical protein